MKTISNKNHQLLLSLLAAYATHATLDIGECKGYDSRCASALTHDACIALDIDACYWDTLDTSCDCVESGGHDSRCAGSTRAECQYWISLGAPCALSCTHEPGSIKHADSIETDTKRLNIPLDFPGDSIVINGPPTFNSDEPAVSRIHYRGFDDMRAFMSKPGRSKLVKAVKASDATCPAGYQGIPNNLDGEGKEWAQPHPSPPRTARDCASICDAREGCTSFEYAKGASETGACGTYTGGDSNVFEDENRLDAGSNWISCVKAPVPVVEVDFSIDSPFNTPYSLKDGAQILTGPGGTRALRIDKDGPYALIPGVNIGPSAMPACTLMIGLYVESFANNRGWVFGHEERGYDRTILVNDDRFGGGLASAVGKTWNPWTDGSKGKVPTKQWVHLTAVFQQNGDSYVYLNGVRSDNKVIATNIEGRNELYVGRPKDWNGHWVDSWIKEVKVFDEALTDSSVEYFTDKFHSQALSTTLEVDNIDWFKVGQAVLIDRPDRREKIQIAALERPRFDQTVFPVVRSVTSGWIIKLNSSLEKDHDAGAPIRPDDWRHEARESFSYVVFENGTKCGSCRLGCTVCLEYSYYASTVKVRDVPTEVAIPWMGPNPFVFASSRSGTRNQNYATVRVESMFTPFYPTNWKKFNISVQTYKADPEPIGHELVDFVVVKSGCSEDQCSCEGFKHDRTLMDTVMCIKNAGNNWIASKSKNYSFETGIYWSRHTAPHTQESGIVYQWNKVKFHTRFKSPPVVLANVQTDLSSKSGDKDPYNIRLRNICSESFEFIIDEDTDRAHVSEWVAYYVIGEPEFPNACWLEAEKAFNMNPTYVPHNAPFAPPTCTRYRELLQGDYSDLLNSVCNNVGVGDYEELCLADGCGNDCTARRLLVDRQAEDTVYPELRVNSTSGKAVLV